MGYMTAGRQCRVVILHRHMRNPRTRGGPEPLYRFECRCVGLARGGQNDFAPIEQLWIGRPNTAVFATCDGMPGHKSWIVRPGCLHNHAFDAGHVRDHGLPGGGRQIQDLWQQLSRGLRRGTDNNDIGLGNDRRQIEAKTINEPQRHTAL